MTTRQNKVLHALLKARGYGKEEKRALVYAFTDKRTEHSSEMNGDEAKMLIDHLQNKQKGGTVVSVKNTKLLQKIKAFGAKACGYKQDEKVEWRHKVVPYICQVANQSTWAKVEEMPTSELLKVLHILQKVAEWREKNAFEGYLNSVLESVLGVVNE